MGAVLSFLGAIVFGVGAGASAAYALAVNIARFALLSLASKFLAPKIDLQQTAEDKLFTVKSAIQPQAFVYGQDMLSGPLLFTNVSGDANEFLHRLVALTGRELQDVVAFRIDDTDIVVGTQISSRNATVASGNFADVVTIATKLGTSTQTAIAQLVTDFPTLWTSAHRARGWALLYVRMEIVGGNTAFEKGVPQNLRALVKGHKVYDPRLDTTQIIDSTTSPITYGSGTHRVASPSTWAWSSNPALCLADWLIWDQVGLSEETDRIDYELVAKAAAICDQDVVIPPTSSPDTTQKRYTCNFTFYADQERGQIKSMLESAMLGRCVFSQGKWRMYAGAALQPTVTLTENNLAGGVHVEASTAAKQRYNTVRGKFVDPTRDYHANAYPEQTNSSYVTDDNSEVKYKTVDFNACNNSYECQRNAIIINRQSRNQKIVRFEGNWSCFRIQVGHVVNLSIAELGWNQAASPSTAKKFLVTEWTLDQEGRGVSLTLVEENDSVWTDPAVGDYTTRSPTGELVPPDQLAVQLTDATIENLGVPPVYAGVRAGADGRLRYGNAANIYYDLLVPPGEWLGNGTDSYYIKATVTAGALASGTEDVYTLLSEDQTWYCGNDPTASPVVAAPSATVRLDITNDPAASPVPVLASGIFTLKAGPVWQLMGYAETSTAAGAAAGETVTLPAHSAGDLLVLYCYNSIGGTLTGWTKRENTNVHVYTRVAATGSTSLTTQIAAPSTDGQNVVAMAFRHRDGATPTFVNGSLQQRLGNNEFPLPALIASGSYDDVLIISGAQRNGTSPANTPLYVDCRARTTSTMNMQAIAEPIFVDYDPTSTRYSYVGCAYATMDSSADATDEWKFHYSPSDDGIGDSGTGYTMRFRGV